MTLLGNPQYVLVWSVDKVLLRAWKTNFPTESFIVGTPIYRLKPRLIGLGRGLMNQGLHEMESQIY